MSSTTNSALLEQLAFDKLVTQNFKIVKVSQHVPHEEGQTECFACEEELMNPVTRIIVYLPCYHWYCVSCFLKLYDSDDEDVDWSICPCRCNAHLEEITIWPKLTTVDNYSVDHFKPRVPIETQIKKIHKRIDFVRDTSNEWMKERTALYERIQYLERRVVELSMQSHTHSEYGRRLNKVERTIIDLTDPVNRPDDSFRIVKREISPKAADRIAKKVKRESE